MKRILIKAAIGLGMLVIMVVLIGLFVRGKEKVCKRDAGPEAIEACSFLISLAQSDSMRAELLSKSS